MFTEKSFRMYLRTLISGIFVLFALTWFYTCTARAYFESAGYGNWMGVINNIRSCNASDVAVLGSSQASVGFLPRLLNIPAKNFALMASTPIENYYEAKGLYRCQKPPKVFIISIAGSDLVRLDWFWSRGAQTGLFSFSDLQEVSNVASQLKDSVLYHGSFGSEPPPTMKNLFYISHFPPYDFASILSSRGFARKVANDRAREETVRNGGEHLFSRGDSCAKTPAWEADQPVFKPTPINLFYFKRLLKLIQEKHAQVFFISPPMSVLTYQKMPLEYARSYRDALLAIFNKYPNITVVGPLFRVVDNCRFADAYHLNAQGVLAFNNEINAEIRHLKYK